MLLEELFWAFLQFTYLTFFINGLLVLLVAWFFVELQDVNVPREMRILRVVRAIALI